jgi:hypothetical protein
LEVHALAWDGWDTGPLLGRFREFLDRGYELDHVVYVYCLNDISDLIQEWKIAAWDIYEEDLGYLLGNSYLLNTWYYRWRISRSADLPKYYDVLVDAYRDERWGEQSRRLEAMRDMVTQHGGRLSVVTFPFLERRDSEDYREIHGRLGARWNELGVVHIDLSETFEGIPLNDLAVNRYDTHPNEYAHGLAADAISRFLRDRVVVPEGPEAPRP